MFMRITLVLMLASAALLLSACGGKSTESATWSEFRYNQDEGEELVAIHVQIKITDCTYELSPDGDILLSVDYALRNLGELPIVYDWDDKWVLDYNGILYEPTDGMSSRTISPGAEQDGMYTRYRLPQTVAVGGGMNRLYWGQSVENGLIYRIKLKPRIIELD